MTAGHAPPQPPEPTVPAAHNRVWAQHEWRLLIAGELRAPRAGRRYASVSPSTEEILASVPDAGREDVEDAVRGAATAQPAWARTDGPQRAAVLRSIARVLRDNAGELAALDAFDGGNPVTAMRSDVELAARLIEHFADLGHRLGGETLAPVGGYLGFTTRVPFGVVARIVPYNHPLMFTASRLAAPLMAGNAVIVKAPDQAPLSALRLGELLTGLIPGGLVSIVSGLGPTAGAAIVQHPQIRRIAFIGSVPVGRQIQRQAADSSVKSVSLELGGKNAMIVCSDADPAEAAAGAVRGMNFHWTAGQSCGSTSRLLVHRRLYADVVDRVAAAARQVVVGDPLLPGTEMGPLITAAHRDRVAGHVARAASGGFRIVTGGRAPVPDGIFRRGFWFSPTVIADVVPGSAVEQTEIFGPVLSVIPFDDDDHAVAIANDTDFGLTASVWTPDIDRALRITDALAAGYVWVNSSSVHVAGMPFGGVKDSGVGREENVEELLSFTQIKAVNIARRPAAASGSRTP